MKRTLLIPKRLMWAFFLFLFFQGVLGGLLLSFVESDARFQKQLRSLDELASDSDGK